MGNFVTNRIYAAIVLSLILLAPSGCNWNNAPVPIVIGHISDKSRADRSGEQEELGIRLALSELTKDDALRDAFNGRPLQVRHTDTRGDLDAYTAQAARLESINRAVVLIGGSSGREAAALANVKTPIVTFHGVELANPTGQVLHLGISPKSQGIALASAISKKKLPSRLCILMDERLPEATIAGEAFVQEVRDLAKGKALADAALTLRFGDKADWAAINKRLREHGPDLVVFAGEVKDFNPWHADLRKEKSSVAAIVFAGGDGDQRRFDLGEAPTSELVYATAFHSGADDKVRAFVKKYTEAFSKPPTVHAALAYDAMRFTADTLKRAAPLTSLERIREELAKTPEFESVTGPVFIDKAGRLSRTIYVVGWSNNRLALLSTQLPKKE